MSDCAGSFKQIAARTLALIRSWGDLSECIYGISLQESKCTNDIIWRDRIGLVWLVGSLLLAALDLSNANPAEGIPKRVILFGLWGNSNRYVCFAILNRR
jgi:hypothetical protein